MNYKKPELALGGSAVAVIQGMGVSKGTQAFDAVLQPHTERNISANAYEADE